MLLQQRSLQPGINEKASLFLPTLWTVLLHSLPSLKMSMQEVHQMMSRLRLAKRERGRYLEDQNTAETVISRILVEVVRCTCLSMSREQNSALGIYISHKEMVSSTSIEHLRVLIQGRRNFFLRCHRDSWSHHSQIECNEKRHGRLGHEVTSVPSWPCRASLRARAIFDI